MEIIEEYTQWGNYIGGWVILSLVCILIFGFLINVCMEDGPFSTLSRKRRIVTLSLATVGMLILLFINLNYMFNVEPQTGYKAFVDDEKETYKEGYRKIGEEQDGLVTLLEKRDDD